METDNYSADSSYTTDRDIERDRDMDIPITAFDSKPSSGRRSRCDDVPNHTLKVLYLKQGRLGVIEREGTVRGKYAKFAATQ